MRNSGWCGWDLVCDRDQVREIEQDTLSKRDGLETRAIDSS